MQINRETKLAPLAIFAYKRPMHLEGLLESLSRNDEINQTNIFIFIDGAKNESERALIRRTEEISLKFAKGKNAKVVCRNTNLGLAGSIKMGVDEVLEHHDSVIVVEDDLEVSPNFLSFLNKGLYRYQDYPQVASIQAHSILDHRDLASSYFLLGADCWGWGTWKNKWQEVNWDASQLIRSLEFSKKRRKFDLNGAYPYTNMLERCANGEVDSWAIRWHASMFLTQRMSVYPPKNLVINNGRDGSGTHAGDSFDKRIKLQENFQDPKFLEPKENSKINFYYRKEIRKMYKTFTLFSYKKYLEYLKRKVNKN